MIADALRPVQVADPADVNGRPWSPRIAPCLPLYAITVHRWWAAAIAVGAKDEENRARRPPARMMGEGAGFVAIHAGRPRSAKLEELDRVAVERAGGAALVNKIRANRGGVCDHRGDLRASAIVAVARIGSVRAPLSAGGRWSQRERWGWRFDRVWALREPWIEVPGNQGTWRIKGRTADLLAAALPNARLVRGAGGRERWEHRPAWLRLPRCHRCEAPALRSGEGSLECIRCGTIWAAGVGERMIAELADDAWERELERRAGRDPESRTVRAALNLLETILDGVPGDHADAVEELARWAREEAGESVLDQLRAAVRRGVG